MVYFSSYTADRVKLARTYVEILRHKRQVLNEGQVQSLLDEISDILDVNYTVTQYESKMNNEKITKRELQREATALRRAKLGL